jgi:hypothetical protein
MNKISRRALLAAAVTATSACIYTRYLGLGLAAGSAAAVKPLEYLVPATDTKFGGRVVKVTRPNHPIPGLGLIWGRVAIHHYSIDQAWNSDQSLLLLDRGAKPRVFLDGKTYRPLMALRSPGEVRWHPLRSEDMIFVAENSVGLWNVRKNVVVARRTFSDYREASFGHHKGNPSDDGRAIAVTATRSDGKRVVFAYNLETDEKHPDIDVSGEYQIGHTSISPTGSLVIVYSFLNKDPGSRRRRVFTAGGKLLQTWTEYERPGHGDFAIDRNGDEVFVGRSKSRPERWQIITRRLVDGEVTVLSPPCYASHVSARNLRDRDWIFATFSQGDDRYGFAPYKSEIAAVSMDGSQMVRRLAQTHATPNGFLTEPHGCPSPDGRRVIFASNWGDKTGPVAAYVAEFQ